MNDERMQYICFKHKYYLEGYRPDICIARYMSYGILIFLLKHDEVNTNEKCSCWNNFSLDCYDGIRV